MATDTSPAANGAAVTKSDTTILPEAVRAIFVGGAGNVAVVTSGGDTLTFSGVTAGTILLIRVTKILSTGTTATSMVIIW